MKKMILALAMVALMATVALGAYSNIGYKNFTSTATVTITGAPASNLSIAAISADCTFTINPDRADDGSTFTVRSGQSVTLTGIDVYGFTVTLSGGTADAVWWY